MSTVTSRNGARPPDNGRPFITFLDIASARKRLADFIELRAFLRFHGEVTSSREAIRRRSRPFLFSLSLSLSYLFSMKEISKMIWRKGTPMKRRYSKYHGARRWRKKFKVWGSISWNRFTFFMDQEDTLGNGWVLFILLLGNRRFILRLDKKIKNLIFVNNFPFPPSYSPFYLLLRTGLHDLWFTWLIFIPTKRK